MSNHNNYSNKTIHHNKLLQNVIARDIHRPHLFNSEFVLLTIIFQQKK